MSLTDIEALIRNRLERADAGVISNEVEQHANSSILAFRDRLREVISTNPLILRSKLESHVSAIITRLFTTTRLDHEVSYAELYRVMSKRIRNKFDLALTILVKENLVIENTKRGRCFYRLNVLLPKEGDL